MRGVEFRKRNGGILVGVEDAGRLGVEHIERQRHQRRMDDFMTRRKRGLVVRKRSEKALRRIRNREGAEIEARDDGERAAGTDKKLVEIVSSDIFDHAAAALDLRAISVDKFCAKEEIARGAIGVAQRRIEASGDGTAYRGLRIKGNEQRQKLILLAQHCVELCERHAGADADG